MNDKKPNFFIIGSPRAGTSALHYLLKQHPDIFMCHPKEPSHFCNDLNNEREKKTKKIVFHSREKYLGLFSKWSEEKVAGEATPHYIFSENAAKNIYEFNPKAKIVVIFREPISFMESYHSQSFFIGVEDVYNFKSAIEMEKYRKEGSHIPKNCRFPSLLFYTELIKYADCLKNWYDYFPKNQVKVIIYDDFKANNKKIYSEICDFLEVDNSFDPIYKQVNTSKNLKYNKLQIITRNIAKLNKLFSKILPWPIYHRLKESYDYFLKSKSKAQIDNEFKQKLKKLCLPEVEKLEDLLSVELKDKWGY